MSDGRPAGVLTAASRTALLASYCVLVAAANARAVSALWERSLQDNTASHITLIPFITAALVAVGVRNILASTRTWWSGGLVVIVLGVMLRVATSGAGTIPDQDLTLAVAPLIILWTGGFMLVYGPSATRSAAFPLAFLWLTLPFPPWLLVPANDLLKQGSTEVVSVLFSVTGTPYLREAFTFRLPFVSIEVADECSGIRSSIGLFITSLLAGHLFLEANWKRALLVLAIVPITVFKNGARIAILSLLSIHVDPGYLSGQLHHEGGIVFFLLSLVLFAPLLFALQQSGRAGRRSSGLSKVPASS